MIQDTANTDSKYQLFIEKTAATKMVWGLLSKEGWANSHSAEDEEVAVVPFWSDRALAKACARDDWRSFTPTAIPLPEFLESWCVGMADDGTLVGANWDANLSGKESEALAIALDILTRIKDTNSTLALKNYGSVDEFIADINQSDE